MEVDVYYRSRVHFASKIHTFSATSGVSSTRNFKLALQVNVHSSFLLDGSTAIAAAVAVTGVEGGDSSGK